MYDVGVDAVDSLRIETNTCTHFEIFRDAEKVFPAKCEMVEVVDVEQIVRKIGGTQVLDEYVLAGARVEAVWEEPAQRKTNRVPRIAAIHLHDLSVG